jgi:RIO kinase 1
MNSSDDDFVDLTRADFTRGSLAGLERATIAREFAAYVCEVIGKTNDGKEATIYLCRAQPAGRSYFAAKMYRARKFRAFANDVNYGDRGRPRDRRLRKAMQQRTRKGRYAAHHVWIDREWDALRELHAAGASVPEPIARCASGILMEWLGVGDERAPMLSEIGLSAAQARAALPSVIRDLEILLDCGLIHGDLSAYNLAFCDGRVRMIDLPQAVAVDSPGDVWSLFLRDVTNVTRYFERCGVAVDALTLASRLWRQR